MWGIPIVDLAAIWQWATANPLAAVLVFAAAASGATAFLYATRRYPKAAPAMWVSAWGILVLAGLYIGRDFYLNLIAFS